ncbi:uncharacterized protein [Drosophila takahashii]|uniref:uncharacterized protein n=1 Tax=Drosophila takahashii TaxID=29030 RepID=UPI001CF846CF|nr:uncharacterized protein LOC108065463 [Drosophila takahashii]
MLRLAQFLLSLLVLDLQGSLGDTQDNNRTVCLLNDPPNQCGQFCLTTLQPMTDLISEINAKLNGIQGAQQSIQIKLAAVESGLEDQRTQIDRIPTKEDFESRLNETEAQLMEVKSEMKDQFDLLQIRLEDQSEAPREPSLNETENQLVAVNFEDLLKTGLTEVLTKIQEYQEAAQTKLEGQLQTLETKLQTLLENQRAYFQKTVLETLERVSLSIPPNFEKIGHRYFYIENSTRLDFYSAETRCRQLGGYLAAIQNQEELSALTAKLDKDTKYWLGIKGSEWEFVSVASKATATFLKFAIQEGSDYFDGVYLFNGEMYKPYDLDDLYFICQADNKV